MSVTDIVLNVAYCIPMLKKGKNRGKEGLLKESATRNSTDPPISRHVFDG